MMMEVETFNI